MVSGACIYRLLLSFQKLHVYTSLVCRTCKQGVRCHHFFGDLQVVGNYFVWQSFAGSELLQAEGGPSISQLFVVCVLLAIL